MFINNRYTNHISIKKANLSIHKNRKLNVSNKNIIYNILYHFFKLVLKATSNTTN